MLVEAWRDIASNLFFLGDFTHAATYLEQGLRHFESQPLRTLTVQSGQGIESTMLGYRAWNCWLLGYPEQAQQTMQQAVRLGQPHVHSQVFTSFFAAVLYQWQRDADAVYTQVETGLNLARANGFLTQVARIMPLQGWVMAMRGETAAGIDLLQKGIADYQTEGYDVFVPYMLALLTEVYGNMGDLTAGLETLAQALTLTHTHSERWWEAELYRLRAVLLLKQSLPDIVQAEESLQHALAVAQQQHAKSLELRVSISLSRLWHQQGEHHRALNALEGIYNWFQEGHHTAELQDARALLAQLRQL